MGENKNSQEIKSAYILYIEIDRENKKESSDHKIFSGNILS